MKEKDGKFCNECGAKLNNMPEQIIVQIKNITEEAIEKTKKCSMRNHAGCDMTESNDCLNCFKTKTNAFNEIVEMLE